MVESRIFYVSVAKSYLNINVKEGSPTKCCVCCTKKRSINL